MMLLAFEEKLAVPPQAAYPRTPVVRPQPFRAF
jgi:hypothetical protein